MEISTSRLSLLVAALAVLFIASVAQAPLSPVPVPPPALTPAPKAPAPSPKKAPAPTPAPEKALSAVPPSGGLAPASLPSSPPGDRTAGGILSVSWASAAVTAAAVAVVARAF